MLVDLPLGCSFLLSFWQSSPVGQRLVTGPYRSAGKTGKCALQLGSHVALNLRVPLLKNRKTHGGIHKKCPVLQAVISGFIVSTLTITHNVGARCQRSGLLSAPSLVLPTCTVSWKTDGCLWKRGRFGNLHSVRSQVPLLPLKQVRKWKCRILLVNKLCVQGCTNLGRL